MVWCPACRKDQPTSRDDITGSVCCVGCGRVQSLDVFTEEPTFVKGAGGQSQLAGSYVKSIQEDYSQSFARTLSKGEYVIDDLASKLGLSDGSTIRQAYNFYRIAIERSFTRGRRYHQVAAACLYIACRVDSKPFLLIEFSNCLEERVNVYVLGAVYLQLCRLLSLEQQPFVQKPVDPSLFMHRFTSALLKLEHRDIIRVSGTALHIVASMKRDWLQTGRKPSGICGAALYISALSHGYKSSKSEVVKVVHICEATLTKRLIEFENTKSGSLTIDEFIKYAEELKKDNDSCNLQHPQYAVGSQESSKSSMEVLCEHKGQANHFAHGLCRDCYKDFVVLSGGLHGGSEPPAFQLAEKERLSKESDQDVNAELSFVSEPQQGKSSCADHADSAVENPDLVDGKDALGSNKPDVEEETDNFSDIDDVEVDCYLNNEEESRFKKIIWEKMNKEYLEEQAKKAAAAAFTFNSDAQANSAEFQSARELATAAAAAVAKSREQRRQKRALEAKNAGPAQNAAEATHQMLTKKRLSSKINYDVLEKLFEDNITQNSKKSHTESHHNDKPGSQQMGMEENEAETATMVDEQKQNYEDVDLGYYENEEIAYDYDYDNVGYDDDY